MSNLEIKGSRRDADGHFMVDRQISDHSPDIYQIRLQNQQNRHGYYCLLHTLPEKTISNVPLENLRNYSIFYIFTT